MADHITTPYFPQDLENYAPWVAKHGLLYPYGDCQCGCGQKTRIAGKTRGDKGWVKGSPVRHVNYHHRNGYYPTRPPRYASIEEAFWARLCPGKPDDCWEWQGQINPAGYGVLSHSALIVSAHRFSYELHKGPIADGMFVCHACDNPKCCNPEHLWLGTCRDNIADMMQKGRHAKGETNGRPKLTNSDIVNIRQLHATGTKTIDIARQYNIHANTVRSVVSRRTWKHIP